MITIQPDNGQFAIYDNGRRIGTCHSLLAAETYRDASNQGPSPFRRQPRWDEPKALDKELRGASWVTGIAGIVALILIGVLGVGLIKGCAEEFQALPHDRGHSSGTIQSRPYPARTVKVIGKCDPALFAARRLRSSPLRTDLKLVNVEGSSRVVTPIVRRAALFASSGVESRHAQGCNRVGHATRTIAPDQRDDTLGPSRCDLRSLSVHCCGRIASRISARPTRNPSLVTESFLTRLAMVESNGRDSAIGDGGKAKGRYQLWAVAWQEVNTLRKSKGLPTYTYCNSTNHATARLYAREYLQILEKQFTATQGQPPTLAQLHALWNLGFRGFQRRGFSLAKTPKSTQRAAKRLNG